MKIAAITITLNDDFKFKEWFDYYTDYKDELYRHIIIDNGSDPDYLSLVKSKFLNSEIIERKDNGGCTIAYNDGLKLILSDPEVDAIMLIGNDIKFPRGHLTNLYNYLYSEKDLGMVAPILLKKDCKIVESYGCRINFFNQLKSLYINVDISSIKEDSIIVDAVPGGMNLSKRKFYEMVGFQDEKLFMYCDEPDMARRAVKAGYKIGATKKSLSWHQHINPHKSTVRNSNMAILNLRNMVYVSRKHDGVFKAFLTYIYMLNIATINIIRNRNDLNKVKYFKAYYKGLWLGIKGDMNNHFINNI